MQLYSKGIFYGVNRYLPLMLVLFLFASAYCNAQSIDTLNIAKELRSRGKIKAASAILKEYHDNHPNDLNTLWLYAQTEYWAKHFKKSKALYEEAIQANSNNYYLKLDYAKMLVSIDELEKAKPLLAKYEGYDSTSEDLRIILARIAFFKGNYKEAAQELKKVIAKEKDNKEASALLDEIMLAASPWLKINAAYLTDDQPLQSITPAIEAGVYLHLLADLHFGLQAPVYIRDGKLFNSQWLQAGNKFNFYKAGLDITLDAGIVKLPAANKINWTGNFLLNKTFAKHLVLSAQVQRRPYYYTRASLDSVVMQNNYSASIGWNDLNSWNGKIAFEADQFPSGNNFVYAFTGWLFAPPLKVSVFEFRLGYGYSYSTAKENKFVSEETLPQIIANYETTTTITGVYNPYFTPYKQSVNSALISIIVHPAKILDLGVSANVGFYGRAQNPYLYLNKDTSGETVIARSFSPITYFPYGINAYASLRVTRKISLKADYAYHSTFFFKSNYVALGIKINFWNEHKAR